MSMSWHPVFRFTFLIPLLAVQVASAQKDVDHAYLGVHASRLDQGLSHQLGLPQGVHLQVEGVVPGSPAELAGIVRFDILLELDDQILVNPEQLKSLVRMCNPGERVVLSVMRKSTPFTLTAELVEAPVDLYNSENRKDFDGSKDFDRLLGPNDRLRDFFRRHSFDFPELQDFHRSPFFSSPRFQSPSIDPPTGGIDLDDPLHSGGTNVQSFTYSSSTQQITVNDDEGSLQWTEKDGVRFLRATDLQGRVVFEGPITSAEDRKTLPLGVASRLQALQDSGQLPAN